jgi:hypothetical protein
MHSRKFHRLADAYVFNRLDAGVGRLPSEIDVSATIYLYYAALLIYGLDTLSVGDEAMHTAHCHHAMIALDDHYSETLQFPERSIPRSRGLALIHTARADQSGRRVEVLCGLFGDSLVQHLAAFLYDGDDRRPSKP